MTANADAGQPRLTAQVHDERDRIAGGPKRSRGLYVVAGRFVGRGDDHAIGQLAAVGVCVPGCRARGSTRGVWLGVGHIVCQFSKSGFELMFTRE